MHDLDLRVAVDVEAMAAAARRPLSKADVALIKYVRTHMHSHAHACVCASYPLLACGGQAILPVLIVQHGGASVT